ncbi:FAD-dependent oxidoreductase [Actinomadura sp. 1N219]|uniref:FAD-dependent oxidoreductase n=1 Tax=Actinomadura sp. 1N219 TaxID=3375152 RepID=UPI0037912161
MAVIGSGVSGMSAAYLLQKKYDVTVFEAGDRLGGHVDTRPSATGRPVDQAFMVFSRTYYPTLTRLLGELDVQTHPADLSTDVVCTSCGFRHLHDDPLGSQNPPPHPESVDPHTWARFNDDHARFVPQLLQALEQSPEKTLGEFFRDNDYSDYFTLHYVFARLTGWLLADVENMPIQFLVNTLARYGFTGGPDAFASWHVIPEGARTYIERIAGTLTSINLATPIRTVARSGEGIDLHDTAGNHHRFDKAVIAVHAPEALAMLANPTAADRAILGAFKYETLQTVLHTDGSALPHHDGDSAIFMQVSCAKPRRSAVSFHAALNKLRNQPSQTPCYVTYNPVTAIDPKHVLARTHYQHPSATPESCQAQERLPELSDNVLAFAGTYHGDGFHEAGCHSGITAATTLGAPWA